MTIPIALIVGNALGIVNTLVGTKAVVLERFTTGAYDPVSGRPAGSTIAVEALTATVVPFNSTQTNVFVDATLLRGETYRVIVAAIGTMVPQAGDTVTIDGVRFDVIGVGKPEGVYNLVVTK